MASQIPAGSSAQAAVRRSRAGGQPRSHAAPYPAPATSVTGHAATASATSSSHPPTLIILRSSHRHTVSFSHDHTLIAAGSGVNAAAGSSRTTTRGWSPGGSPPAARVTTGRAAGAVRYTTCAYRIGDRSPVMIRVVRAMGLGVSSTSTAHTCPAYGLPAMRRPVDLRVRDVLAASGGGMVGAQPPLGMPPGLALAPGRAGLQPQPGRQDRADVRQAAQRGAGGGEPEPGLGHPGPGQPAPPRPRAQPPGVRVPGAAPPRHDRGQPLRLHPQRQGEQVEGRAVMLAAEQEPVDVALAEPDRPGISAAGRAGRSDGVVCLCLCRHDVPRFLPQ